MKNSEQPAFPDPLRGAPADITNQTPYQEPIGLTKREYFAAIALQGILSNHSAVYGNIPELSETAIEYADELLKQLEK